MRLIILCLCFAGNALAWEDGWWLKPNKTYPHWYTHMQEMRHSLMNGQIIRIENFMKTPEAFDVDHLTDWYLDTSPDPKIKNMDWYKRYKSNDPSVLNAFTNELSKHKIWFEDLLDIEFEDLTPINETFALTKYNASCYLDEHNDFDGTRKLTIIYHNSKINKPECGGSLMWSGVLGGHEFEPTYNTAYIFVPTDLSMHSIKKMTCSERTAISGWFTLQSHSSSIYSMMVNHHRWIQMNEYGQIYNVEDESRRTVEVDTGGKNWFEK
tara:strand:- start:5785 stop:6585 length:801 start_codon:yes stop_codon:yes gene_type:complete